MKTDDKQGQDKLISWEEHQCRSELMKHATKCNRECWQRRYCSFWNKLFRRQREKIKAIKKQELRREEKARMKKNAKTVRGQGSLYVKGLKVEVTSRRFWKKKPIKLEEANT